MARTASRSLPPLIRENIVSADMLDGVKGLSARPMVPDVVQEGNCWKNCNHQCRWDQMTGLSALRVQGQYKVQYSKLDLEGMYCEICSKGKA